MIYSELYCNFSLEFWMLQSTWTKRIHNVDLVKAGTDRFSRSWMKTWSNTFEEYTCFRVQHILISISWKWKAQSNKHCFFCTVGTAGRRPDGSVGNSQNCQKPPFLKRPSRPKRRKRAGFTNFRWCLWYQCKFQSNWFADYCRFVEFREFWNFCAGPELSIYL